MKIKPRRFLLPLVLLGGALLNSGCSTPTTNFGTASRSDRVVLSVRSSVPTKVQCAWRQGGAHVQHENTTPFRLVFGASEVREISVSKPMEVGDVEVRIRSASTEPGRFVMEQGTSGMQLVREGGRWEERSL